MARFLDAVLFNPTLGGTTDWTVSSAVQGYNTPALAGAVNGGVYKYRAESSDLSQWEIGEGTYNTTGPVLSRTTVLYNSAGTGSGPGQSGAGTKINFTVPPKVGIIGARADALAIDESNGFTLTQQITARNNIGAFTGAQLNAAQNFNSVTQSGTWFTPDGSATNTPLDGVGNYWYLQHIDVSGSHALQVCWTLTFASGQGVASVYMRTKLSGTWSPWRRKDPLLRNYIDGLILSTAGSSTTFTVAAGTCTNNTNADTMDIPSAMNKTTAAWAVGSGNGALDTGSIAANTWYHVFVIKRLDTQVVDVCISINAAGPSIPAGYSYYRRIGAMKTNGSSQWTKFVQFGNEFFWDTPTLDYVNTALSTAALTFTLNVPNGVSVNAMVNVAWASSTNGAIAYISSFYVADIAPQFPSSAREVVVSIGLMWPQMRVWTTPTQGIKARADNAGNISFGTVGWVDPRGEDS